MPRIKDPATGRFIPNNPVTKAAAPKLELKSELGVSTTHRVGRSLYDDYLPQLRGRKAARVYRQMSEGDPTVSGFLFGIEAVLREITWHADPADESPAAQDAAEFLDTCLDDMTHTWGDHIAVALSELAYGFSAFEIVYRQRLEAEGSKYSDGKWGWRKLAYRPQDSIQEFAMDETGGTQGIVQSVSGANILIPIEKLVLYRTTTQRGPEGKSLLRGAYRPWYFKNRAEEIMAIGIERDLAGLPIGRIPGDSIISADSNYTFMKQLVTRVKRDEQEGVVLPSDRDESGNHLYEFELMSAAGGSERLAGVLAITRAFSQDILASVLADFMGLGRDAVGSRALADPKIGLWLKSLEFIADGIADTLTRHAVPRLMALNGVPRNLSPVVSHSPVKETDVAAVAAALKDFSAAGFPIVADDGEATVNHLRGLVGLPVLENVEG